MPPVNWDEPSRGSVSSTEPALKLENDQDGALLADAEGVAVEAVSNSSMALYGRTNNTLAARLESRQSVAALASAPRSIAVLGVNQEGAVAVAGLNTADPAFPNPTDNPGGAGVLGLTNRFAATGVIGAAQGLRSTGVIGQADHGVGVRGFGTELGVDGQASSGHGVHGRTFGPTAAGVAGTGLNGLAAGVRARSNAGPGVDAASNAGPAVRAVSASAEGVVAEASAANAAAVRALNNHSSGFAVDATSGQGVAVSARTQSGTGIYTETFTGKAVDATNWAGSQPVGEFTTLGSGNGVSAIALGSAAVRAWGETGVEGISLVGHLVNDWVRGSGVHGFGLNGSGVCGVTLVGSGVTGIGVPELDACAGWFIGNVDVDGEIKKKSSCFAIEHPLDPKNKILLHAAVEAPERKTLYDGTVKLNRRGEARVKLPKWFRALNDPEKLRFQLTPIGDRAPNLHISDPGDGTDFQISGGQAGQLVSWQVSGIRRDEWARNNPLRVEQKRPKNWRLGQDVDRAEIKKRAEALQREAKEREKELRKRAKAAANRPFPDPQPVGRPDQGEAGFGAAAKLVKKTLSRAAKLMKGHNR